MPNHFDVALIGFTSTIALVTYLFGDHVFTLPGDNQAGQVFSDEEKKMISRLASCMAILQLILKMVRMAGENRDRERRERRRLGRRLPVRRRMESPSSSSSMVLDSSTIELWKAAKTNLEADLGPLSEAGLIQDTKKKLILPDWLLKPCRTAIRKDDGYICHLMSQRGNEEELIEYIEQNGLHPSDYGVDVQSTIAFFKVHGATLNARLHSSTS